MPEYNEPSGDRDRQTIPGIPKLSPNLESPQVDRPPFIPESPRNELGWDAVEMYRDTKLDSEVLEKQRDLEEEFRLVTGVMARLERRLEKDRQRPFRWDPENEAIAKALLPLLGSHLDMIRFSYKQTEHFDEEKQRRVTTSSTELEKRIEVKKADAGDTYHNNEEAYKNQATMDYLRAQKENPARYPEPLNYPPITDQLEQAPPPSETPPHM